LTLLHWLRVPERVNFKLALMAHRMLNGMAPSYLNQLVPVSSLKPCPHCLTENGECRRIRRQSATVSFLWDILTFLRQCGQAITGRRRLRSSFTLHLLVPSYRLSTVGRRSFPFAASMFWNTLPNDIQSAPSVSAFRRLLKTFLFQHSSPDVIL